MIRAILFWLFLASSAIAQSFTGLARVDHSASSVTDTADGAELTLSLSQIVPYRVFTLGQPDRLVVDFREVNWDGLNRVDFDQSDRVTNVSFGQLRPGWSRMVLELSEPMLLRTASATVEEGDASAVVQIILQQTDRETFANLSGAPTDPQWGDLFSAPTLRTPTLDDDTLVVVIDPGHGGIDPGAEHGGVTEADLMLALGIEAAEALNRLDGVEAILTRVSDVFVPLNTRMTIARQNNADLLISLHADALEEGQARGGSVYTLSDEAASIAARRMAERHQRGDLIAGLDLTDQDDRVASVLMDLARAKTGPEGQRFANALVESLTEQDVRLHRNSLRQGPLAVLNAADFASVLFEVGYLSNDRDRSILISAKGRKPIVDALVAAVSSWSANEELQ